MTPNLFCFGYGFTAREIARQHSDWTVWGTARSFSAEAAEASNATLMQFSGTDPVPGFDALREDITHILLSVPPTEEGDPVRKIMGDLLCDLPSLKWIGYLSTTGVYGDLNGGMATEETPVRPSGIRGQRRVEAEAAWQQLHREGGLPLHIFRLPGIYGPGRNQMVSLMNGKAHRIVKPGHVFSRIHVEDLARILVASMKKPDPGRIYNVADDMPAPPQDVVQYAAELLEREPPPLQDFETADLSPMARSFYSDNKTVNNARIKAELGISLMYPTYKDGLDALSLTI
ncbi:MAG: SDR family oxidoreductase [Sneathiella sp.]